MHAYLLVTPLGTWTVHYSERGIAAMDWEPMPTGSVSAENVPAMLAPLARYFAGEPVDFRTLPIDWMAIEGTPFRQAVWKLLCEIPYGVTQTYGWMALQLGKPLAAARAIGQAVGDNPLPVVIPCHRVLATGGQLGGFMHGHPEGLPLKRGLLALEGVSPVEPKRKRADLANRPEAALVDQV